MMTNLPADLSPETAAWMHAQIAISTARAVAPLREELDKVDDWAGGLFVVFLNVLPHLLRTQPELAAKLEPQWRKAAQRFDAMRCRRVGRVVRGMANRWKRWRHERCSIASSRSWSCGLVARKQNARS